ncbi:DUF2268 domain-containing protein [Radiobacillus deserti]|uniref:Zn-dependent protease n=1 Tax=Radiobacillus deserti TaxID=2594883 RepID=A0A516KKE9_9BACI|nr:DUF2268 domain-containing putative Zn-dependent protease [Radiobacillus deserti]QDP41869.1 Zn-dependent protease [Radiobacillus deserti]
MHLIDTKSWLFDYITKKTDRLEEDMLIQLDTICKKLTPHFPGVSEMDIHQHLLEHGLFVPWKQDKGTISTFLEQSYEMNTKTHLEWLKKEWQGPDVSVFLFPSDHTNPDFLREFNAVSGVSHTDKLFLFLPPQVETKKLQAVLTHEYHHICRLAKLKKQEEEFHLLDTIIAEGLAEYAVQEIVGIPYLSKWATLYSLEESERHWNDFLSENQFVEKGTRTHDKLLYGEPPLPPMIGYNCGYQIAKSSAEKESFSTVDLLSVDSQTVLQKSSFANR